MTLDEAIRQAREGDIAAYEAAVRETATAVRAYLALWVRDRDTVNDLAQETFLYAYEHLREFAPGTDFRAWLKAIARTQALRAWRERQRKDAAHQRYAAAVQGRLAEAAAALDEREPVDGLLERLRRCMERLGEHAQALVRLRYYENRPVRAIAQSQGKSENHVSVALFRVRTQLAACMERPAP